MKKIFFIALATLLFASCAVVKTEGTKIEFQPVQNYFVKNNLKSSVPNKITTREEFEKYFGTATIQWYGKPTEVNFEKEFVIVVALPETDEQTTMKAVNVFQGKNNLEFSYTIERGAKQTYKILPFVMVKVDKKYDLPLTLVQVEAK